MSRDPPEEEVKTPLTVALAVSLTLLALMMIVKLVKLLGVRSRIKGRDTHHMTPEEAREVRQLEQTPMVSSNPLDRYEIIEIDDSDAEFTYLLVRLSHGEKSKVVIMCGDSEIAIYNHIQAEADIHDLRAKYLGGGQLRHRHKERVIELFGDTEKFGRADHEMVSKLLKKKFPLYRVTWRDNSDHVAS